MEPEALNLGCADGPYPRSFFGCGEAADNSSRRLEASVIDPSGLGQQLRKQYLVHRLAGMASPGLTTPWPSDSEAVLLHRE